MVLDFFLCTGTETACFRSLGDLRFSIEELTFSGINEVIMPLFILITLLGIFYFGKIFSHSDYDFTNLVKIGLSEIEHRIA